MVRLTTKTLEEILEAARELLQDSIVTEIYELTYQAAVTTYKLPGFSSNDPRVLSIEAIEGINLAGNYVTEDDLLQGTDYDIWQLNGTVDEGYGASSGENYYQGITITTLTFQDNSIVYIRYRYQSPDFRPILTNFAGNSQILTFLAAVFSNVQQDLVTLTGNIDSYGVEAKGDNLDRMLEAIAGIKRTIATKTVGTVQITNSDSSNSFIITTSTRFVARSSSLFIEFEAVTGSGSVAPLSTANIAVIAVAAGKLGNVGPYSITEVFEDVGLATKAPSYIVVTNPPQILGVSNFFDNGTDEESDGEYLERGQLVIKSFKTSSYSTVEKAALDTGYLSDVTAYDISNRKGIPANNNVLVLQTPVGNVLSATAITTIQDAVLAVAGTGQQYRFEQTMNTYLSIDADIFVDVATLEDTSVLEAQLIATLTNHINSKGIGEDIFPSTLLALMISSVSVRDATINNIEVTEYVSEVLSHDVEVDLTLTGTGAQQNEFMAQIQFNSIVRSETDQYDGADAFFDVANTPIDERINPTVYKAVLDYNNEWRGTPLNIFDYFGSVTSAGTRINYDVSPAGQDVIATNDWLIFDYNQYDQVIIDGLRVLLNGVDGQFIDIELRVGATASSATLVHTDTQKTVILDGNELSKVYEIKFTNPQTLDPASNIYWIHIKGAGTNNNWTRVPIDTTNSPVPFNPELHVDGQYESTPAAPNGTFERIYARATYHTYLILAGADAYNKIVIPSKSRYSESSRLYETTLTFLEFIEE